jgi:hypothetical protein
MNTPETDHEERRIRSDIRILVQLELPTMADFARNLERERDELREALSGRTVSCSQCNEAAAVAALDERDRLMRENERLQAHLDELTASTIHSCGDHCQRPNCVRRREMATMREAIQFVLANHNTDPEACIDKLKPFITP